MKWVYVFKTSKSSELETISSTEKRTKEEMELYLKGYFGDSEVIEIREIQDNEETTFISLVKKYMR